MDSENDGPAYRDLSRPMGRSRLVPVTTIVRAVSELSGGLAPIIELVDALPQCFDCEEMMLYRGEGYGLADALDGNPFDPQGGVNERKKILYELFNSHYWEPVDTSTDVPKFHQGLRFDCRLTLMTRVDADVLARRLWEFFFPAQILDGERLNTLIAQIEATPIEDAPSSISVQPRDEEFDQIDRPEELDAANLAFRAVSNGPRDKATTFKSRLIAYLEKNYSHLSTEAILRIATVANPDKARGRKKPDTE